MINYLERRWNQNEHKNQKQEKIADLEEKNRQLEQNLVAVISNQNNFAKDVDGRFEQARQMDLKITQVFTDGNVLIRRDIDSIKEYQLEHMMKCHADAHKSLFYQIKDKLKRK